VSSGADRLPAETGIAVTRAEADDGPLSERLRARGARVTHWPAVDIRPPEDPRPLDQALADLERFHWIVFSSPRAVAAVTGRAHQPPDRPKVAAIGMSTAQALMAEGWPVHLIPKPFNAEQRVKAFEQTGWANGARVFFPASSIARPTIPEGLTALGADVEQVVAYDTTSAAVDPDRCLADVEVGGVNIVTFTSPSAVRGLKQGLGPAHFARIMERVVPAVIGPTTAEALREAGAGEMIEASPSTLDGLVEAIVAWVGQHDNGRGSGSTNSL
jgi:uroporphyrinogen III methyltransferase/synthase